MKMDKHLLKFILWSVWLTDVCEGKGDLDTTERKESTLTVTCHEREREMEKGGGAGKGLHAMALTL